MKSHNVPCQCENCGKSYRKRLDRVRTPDFCSLPCRLLYAGMERLSKRGRLCAACGNFFAPREYQLKMGQGTFCSLKCSTTAKDARHSPEARRKAVETWHRNGNKVRSGPDHPQFLGKKLSTGYVWIWVEGRGYIQEHRLVMETSLGRKLLPQEIVHHINRDRTDNRLQNLELTNQRDHTYEHASERQAARRLVKLSKGQKLTASQVSQIKLALKDGLTPNAVALKFNVTPTMISYIRNGKSWAHVA